MAAAADAQGRRADPGIAHSVGVLRQTNDRYGRWRLETRREKSSTVAAAFFSTCSSRADFRRHELDAYAGNMREGERFGARGEGACMHAM